MPPTLQASRLAGEPRSIHVGVTTPQRGNPLHSHLLSSTPSVLTKSPWHSALDKPNHLLMQKIQLTSGGSPRTLSSQQTPVVCLGNAPKMKLPATPTANITAAYPKGLTPSLKSSPLLLSSTPGLKTSSLSLKSRTPLLSKTSSPLENCLLKSAEGGRTAIGTVGSLQSPLLTSGFKTPGDKKLLLETKSSLLSPELSKLPGKPDKKLLDTSQTWSKSATLRKSQSKQATKTPAGKSQENSEKKKIRSPTKHKEKDEKKAAEMIEVPPPKYELFDELRKEKPVDMPTFLPPGPVYMPETSSKKVALLNAVSSSLICSPNFKDAKNEMRAHLLSVAESVALYDPEFVLKTALYARRELNIRTPANFLLALASNIKECRVFIKKYFKEAIRLPSDWIDVAELYQAFYDKSINYGSLPAALRRSMVAKFPDFDKYQLAKYNKDKSKSKKKGKPKGGNDRGAGKGKFAAKGRTEKPQELSDSESSDEETESDVKNVSRTISTGEETETEEELEQRTFTLKQLIRKLHITEPVEHVMCLIGKKYPESLEEFYAARIPGTWEEERAGKRMKLPVPITWETQLSLKGNKAATWEQLIDSKKLPYMAMLRNLRNMIKAGISPKHHNWVIKKLCDQGSVIYSKQFPFRFFSAYEILDQLEADYQKNQSDIIEKATKEATGQPTQDRKQMSKLMKAAKSSDGTIKWWLLKKNKKKQGDISEVPFDTRLLNRYRKALDNAVKIATVYNVQPIRGRTVIFCDVSDDMLIPCTAARGLGKPRMLKEVGLLLGLMCKYSCEESELILYDHHRYSSVQVDKGTILDNVNILQHLDLEKDSNAGLSESGFPKAKLTEFLRDRVQIDNLIVLSPGLDSESGFDIPGLGGEKGKQLSDFLLKYRRIVSPDLLFVTIALAGKHGSVDVNTEHPNDISVSGYSDQILRFIAERGSGAQLTHVENIDTAYNLDPKLKVSLDKSSLPTKALKPTKLPRPVETVPVPVWRTVRVFISSTFRDMHGERDILTRFIFPELRARCRRHFIHVLEVDLRWGVTEEDTKRKQAVDICLSEVNKCQFFIGLLGERQGWVPLTSDLPESPSWLREHPEGASVTELEMEAARRKFGDLAKKRAFFYIRQSDFIKAIPQKYRQDFEAEHSVSKRRVDELKERVRQSGLCALDGYPCTWGGAVDGKPFAGDLGDFGLSVLTRLWVGIRRMYPEVEVVQNQDEQISELHEAAMEAESSKFIGRKQLLKQCLSTLVENPGSVLVLSGKHGSGKSALTAALREEYIASSQCADQDSVLGYMVGSAPGSTNLTSILRLICADLSHRFSLHAQIPQEYKNLVPKLWEVLKLAGKQSLSPVVVFIDGVDWMEEAHQPYNMEWLPSTLPRNVQFVLTAVEGGRCHKALLRRGVKEVKVAGLDIMDKPKVVRSILAQHRKALDESAFNNQMKLLLSKREAANPLYLALACEELRVFSVFEKVTSKLRSLPHTVPQLLGEILTRMETDVGVDLVKTSLCILLLSRHGISESELHSLLSMHKIAGKGDNSLEEMVRTKLQPEDFLPPAVFLQLQRALQAFLRPMDSKTETFSLAHFGMEEAVSRRYLAQKSDETKNHLHKLLAGYYWQSADPSGDSRWNGLEEKAFSELPYHLIRGRYFSELETILCDLHFIQKRCQLGQTSQLLEDFSHKELKSAAVQEYWSFVSHQIHILSRYPGLTIQQALNDRPDSAPSLDAEEILNTRQAKQHTGVIRWTNRPEHTDQCRLTISDLPYVVTCVAISPCERFLVCGDSDCSVKLYEVATGKELRTFHGHSNKVTDVSYVGQSRVVSAAKDGMLILWDANTGQKVALLKGHSRSVNSCCSNGNLVASAGWDCNIKIWSAKNGAHIWEFKDIKPVNCVAFHPEDESVVTGGWDTNLKIWDIINRKRKAVLRGHTASVRDAAFSPSGRYIASASLDGEVKLWSALNGSQLGEIRGHNLPINKLQFSPSGKDLITVSDDQKIKVWSGHLGRLLHAMDGEPGPLCVAFCPLGESLAVGYNNGELAVFDVESGMAQFRVQPAKDAVRSITYTPNGQYIVLGAEDASIMVLDSTTGDFVYSMDGHTEAVVCVTAATKALATTSDDFTCCVYKHQSAYQLKTKKNKVVPPVAVLRGHEGSVTSCCFNPDETRLATVSKDMSVRIWDLIGLDLDLIDWEPITIMQACHGDWITDCKWSNIGDFLVTSSNDFTAKVWDLNTGNEKTALTGHTSTIHSLAYKYGCVVTTSSDNTAKVWSHKGTEITTLYGHNDRVIACDLFIKVTEVAPVNIDTEPSWGDIVEEGEKPKKKVDKTAPVKFEEVVVATCSDEGTIRLWKPLQANEKACLTGHSNKVLSLACSKSGTLSTSSADQSVKVWSSEVTADDLIGRHNGEVTCVMPSWDQRFVASCSRDGTLKLWRNEKLLNQNFELCTTIQAHSKSVNAVCFLRDDMLATASDDETIQLWRIHSTDKDLILKRQWLVLNASGPVSCLMYTPDGYLVSGDWTGSLTPWHLNEEMTQLVSPSSSVCEVPGAWIMGLRYRPDYMKSVLTVATDNKLRQWRIREKARGFTLEHWASELVTGDDTTCATDVDAYGNTCFVALSDGNLLKCLVPHSHSEPSKTFQRETKKVHAGSISAVLVTKRLVFTASADCTVKVWTHDLAQVGQFCCPSPVTCLRSSCSDKTKGGDNPNIICGDKLGNVYFLSWLM